MMFLLGVLAGGVAVGVGGFLLLAWLADKAMKW